jgi:hypothetical protein
MQWNALDLTGPCSSSSAHRRFQEWERAGVFQEVQRPHAAEADARLDPIERPEPTPEAPEGICLDKAYDNEESRELVAGYDLTPHIRSRGEPHSRLARAALGRRGLPLVAKPQPRDPDPLVEEDQNHLALLQLASGLIAFKKAHAAKLAALPA